MSLDVDEIEDTDEIREPPVQFGMWLLLVAPVFVAVLVLLLKYTPFIGGLFGAIVTLVLHFWPVPRQYATIKRLGVDVLGGIVLPLLCLGLASPLNLLIYLTYGFQTLVLASWMLIGRCVGVVNSLVGGMLLVGMGLAMLTGLLLLPPSIAGLTAFGVESLGLFPFFTAYIYGRCAIRAFRRAREAQRPLAMQWLFWLGIVAGLLAPLVLYPICNPLIPSWLSPYVEPIPL